LRIVDHLKRRQFIDAYVVAALALTFSVLTVIGDIVSDDLKWAATLAGVGILVYRITLSKEDGRISGHLQDRSAFDGLPFTARIRNAREVWIYAPSGINLLSPQTCEALRTTVLGHPQGIMRVVVLDPSSIYGVQIASQQLDGSIEFPIQTLGSSLESSISTLRRMQSWDVPGDLQVKMLSYNPGFSLVAIDPQAPNGSVIVEFHGFHNTATTSRMHIELTRSTDYYWYTYWTNQFDHLWRAALHND
jgi:hypothetical protein